MVITRFLRSRSEPHPSLTNAAKGVSIFIGILLIVLSAGVYHHPALSVSLDKNGFGEVSKQHLFHVDPTIPFMICFISGAVFVLYGLNGLRIAEVSKERVTGLPLHQQQYEDNRALIESVASQAEEELETTIGSESPEDAVKVNTSEFQDEVWPMGINDGRFNVYSAEKIPFNVLIIALSTVKKHMMHLNNPLEIFEFAARRSGQGNNRWMIKFTHALVVISPGGRAPGGQPKIYYRSI